MDSKRDRSPTSVGMIPFKEFEPRALRKQQVKKNERKFETSKRDEKKWNTKMSKKRAPQYQLTKSHLIGYLTISFNWKTQND